MQLKMAERINPRSQGVRRKFQFQFNCTKATVTSLLKLARKLVIFAHTILMKMKMFMLKMNYFHKTPYCDQKN